MPRVMPAVYGSQGHGHAYDGSGTLFCENDPGASNLDFGWRVVVL